MSSELKREVIRTGRKLRETSCEQRLDMDISLPDYCADIKKIIRCSLLPGIHTVSLSGERASAKGTGVLRVIYLAEGDKIDSFEKSVELSPGVQLKESTPDGVVRARAVVDFINCRAVSQRKISISASVSTIFSLYGLTEDFIALADENDKIETKKEKLTCENHLGFFEKTFDLAETLSLSGDRPPVGKILSCFSRTMNITKKLSSGKLLIKGDAVTDICYLPEKAENTLHTLTHTMPISQIVDLRDMPDTASCDVTLKVCQQLCTPKADSSGSNRLVDIALRVSAFVSAFEKKECEVITDCYCIDLETEEDFESTDMLCPLREVGEQKQAKGEVVLPSPAKEICFAKCLETVKSVKYTREKAELDCSALVLIMYIDEKGLLCLTEKNLDFDFSCALIRKCTDPFGFFELEPLELKASPVGDKAELTLDYSVKGRIYQKNERKLLKSLTIFEDKPKKKEDAALTIYFTDKGESLWDIARSHNTTIRLIMEENGLESEELKENMMLMLPCG